MKISINYDNFIHINYTLHQVCSSVFVTENWINYLHAPSAATHIIRDFRTIAPFAFQALSAFCDLINNTISDSLTRFYSNQYVSASVTPSQLFETETQSLVDQFRSSMTNSFLLFLLMIRNTTHVNALHSMLGINSLYDIINLIDRNDIIVLISKVFTGCDCRTSSTCIDQASIYDLYGEKRLFNVSNFNVGCYLIESLLQSSLECFYNDSCINEIQKYLPSSSSMIVRPLNSSLLSESLENSTIQELLDKLMIEEWNSSQLYDRYYNECNPKQCTYTREILLGIVGGLTTVLRVVVPQVVKFIMYFIRKLRRRAVSEVSIIET
jgi:hypothetical protein